MHPILIRTKVHTGRFYFKGSTERFDASATFQAWSLGQLQAALPLANAGKPDDGYHEVEDKKVDVEEVESLLARLPEGDNATSRRQSALALRLCGHALAAAVPDASERTALAHKAWTRLEEMNNGPALGAEHYNSLLAVYLENGHAFSPEHMLSRLEKGGVRPDKETYRAMLDRYCQSGDMEGASGMLKVSKGEISCTFLGIAPPDLTMTSSSFICPLAFKCQSKPKVSVRLKCLNFLSTIILGESF